MATVRWSAVVVLVMALTGAACASETSAGSGGGIYGGSPSSSGSETSPMPTSGGGGYGTGGGGGGGGGGGKSVATVGQSNYVFTPSKPKVASADTITVKNSTPSTPHTFTVDGEDIDVAVDPGSSQDVKIGLPAGTYDFHCRYHESQGMVGTLTVT